MKINSEFIVKIDDVDINGNGVTRINNLVVFVKNALKDEIVKIKIISLNKRFASAEIVEIIEKSSIREDIKCPFYNLCGGCNFLHINANEELIIKENYIKKLFKDYNVKNIASINNYNYRNKVTLHVVNSKIGFFNENTNNLVEIDNCLLLDNNINNLIKKLKKLDLKNIYEIVIRKSIFNKELLLWFKGKASKEELKEFAISNNITSLSLNDELIYGKKYIVEKINNIKYTIYKEAFFQVNTSCMIKLYDKIKEYSETGNILLDLYCGTGTIGIYLKDNYKKVLGIEENIFAIENANINKKINNIENIEFKCLDASKIKINDFDTVVVDPPRSGLTKNVIKNILNGKARKIIYVSCNPKTLNRDLELLEEKYKVIEIAPFNMFFRTKHIECVCLLKLR